ncbi:hypothetical protein J8I87_27250 [Paraburkholderia sp. LEh10]|uniref:hypothetical protein n=1 Tax=Paraburkholderia sp. LEh10 TaxID=2821353 RepID=UPI001AE81B62|nr:hypothetical protein [Paraburkholderia sp. LEh10]MBP0593334.1 hypothetical protein [Paraburkholderia sp. LEh10]
MRFRLGRQREIGCIGFAAIWAKTSGQNIRPEHQGQNIRPKHQAKTSGQNIRPEHRAENIGPKISGLE